MITLFVLLVLYLIFQYLRSAATDKPFVQWKETEPLDCSFFRQDLKKKSDNKKGKTL